MKSNVFKILVYVFIAISIVWLILYQPIEPQSDSEIYKVKVEETISDEVTDQGGVQIRKILHRATIIDDRLEGAEIIVEDTFEVNEPYHIFADPGDKLLCFIAFDASGTPEIGYIVKFIRTNYIIFLVAVFVILLLVIGHFQGFKAIVSLGLTLLMVFKILLPQILAGTNPVIISVVVTIIITIFSLIIIGGFNKKTYSSMIGTLCGVFIGGGLAILVSSHAKVLGLSFEEAQFIKFASHDIQLSFSGLLFASILLGTLGAVMDVCMSIASSIEEIKLVSPYISTKELFKAGMHVGKDVMGTMINTLILAYAGSSLLLMLMYQGYRIPFIEIINDDLIVTEIIRSLAGTIGLISAIPITAFIATSMTQQEQNF